MKLKARVTFLLTGALIFFVTHKTLQLVTDHGSVRTNDDDVTKNVVYRQLDHGDVRVDVHRERADRRVKVMNIANKYKLVWNVADAGNVSSLWSTAADWVNGSQIIADQAPELGAVLRAMNARKILQADVGYRGTQLKLTLTLEGNQRVVFKPKWFERDFVILGKPFDGADRHNGEIATFHLARILGFNRTPLVVGRKVNLKKEIIPVAKQRLIDTFFIKDGANCFYGKCLYCKGPQDGVCASLDSDIEGAVVLWLPPSFKLKTFHHPWGRTYKDGKLASWELDDRYCDKVLQSPLYSEGRLLLDIMDAAVLDYLIGNADRHHYEVFANEDDAMLLLMDNAKSFGNPYHDERSILAPIYQCCRLRESTWHRLASFEDDGMLGDVLEEVLSEEPISPVLTWTHYKAIDRRLISVLGTIRDCIEKHGRHAVIIG